MQKFNHWSSLEFYFPIICKEVSWRCNYRSVVTTLGTACPHYAHSITSSVKTAKHKSLPLRMLFVNYANKIKPIYYMRRIFLFCSNPCSFPRVSPRTSRLSLSALFVLRNCVLYPVMWTWFCLAFCSVHLWSFQMYFKSFEARKRSFFSP